jgi:hypothetical protein
MKLRRGNPDPDGSLDGSDAKSGVMSGAKSAKGKSGRSGKEKAKEKAKEKKELVTPGNAKKAISIGKILVPVLAPVAMQLAGVARGAWDERRARRLGVPASELGSYSGKGGALHARIARISMSIGELSADPAPGRADEVARFAAENGTRLADLSAAVRAAEMMPTERRRAAHKAVSAELDQIEPKLLALLGVDSPGIVVHGPTA